MRFDRYFRISSAFEEYLILGGFSSCILETNSSIYCFWVTHRFSSIYLRFWMSACISRSQKSWNLLISSSPSLHTFSIYMTNELHFPFPWRSISLAWRLSLAPWAFKFCFWPLRQGWSPAFECIEIHTLWGDRSYRAGTIGWCSICWDC